MKNWRYYFVTLATVIGIGVFKTHLNNYFHINSPMLLFFAAIALSAWVGGFFHGLLATVFSMVFIHSFFLPQNVDVQDWTIRYILYFIDGMVITLICFQLRRSRNSLKAAYYDLTEAKDSLNRTESKIHRIFESNMMGIVFSDKSWKIIDANQYFLKLLGVTQEDLVSGRISWANFVRSEGKDEEKETQKRLEELESGAIAPFEKEFIRKDGTRIPVLIGAAKAGEDSYVAFILDNTDRKRIERELAQNNERLEEGVALRTKQITEANQRLIDSQSFLDSVIENIPNMIFVKDAKDLKFLRFNKAGSEILGISVDELLGKNDHDFFPPEQAEQYIAKDKKVLQEKVKVEIEEEPLMTTKGMKYLRTVKIPILDKNQEPLYLLGISEDITEKKTRENQTMQLIQEQAARAEAEKSAARFAFFAMATAKLNESLDIKVALNSFANTIVNNMSEWCMISFHDANINRIDKIVFHSTRHNSLEAELHNEPTAEVTGILLPVLKDGKKLLFKELTRDLLIQSGIGSFAVEAILKQKASSMMILPLVYHGRVFGAMHLVSGPEQPAYTTLDLAVAQDLAKRASLAVENARFYKKASEANKAKSAFLANISHEIRTPLGAMLGFAELAMDDPELSEKTSSYITTILKNGNQLLSLVDEVLDISKIESEKLEIENVNFSPVKMVEDIITLLGVKAKAKGLALDFHIEGQLPSTIVTDQLRLRQILLNIIGNAIKFTEQGSVHVTAKFTSTDVASRKGMLEFFVKDTGIGINETQRRKLFEPFMQVDTSMTRKFGGTGLGLFLSRKLARLLNGDVLLNPDVVEGGSEFRIHVNVEYISDEIVAHPHDWHIEPDSKAQVSSHKGRVLVVEDSPENRIIVSTFLSKMGLTSDMAVNGVEGVEKALASNYDVVLMDIQMPEMDGFEAITQLRREGYTGTVIALTAHAMKGDREKCLDHGFDDYLCKPISRRALAECISQYIPVSEEMKNLI